MEVDYKAVLVMLATLVKINGEVMPSGLLAELAIGGNDAYLSVVSTINQVAVDGTLEVYKVTRKMTLKELLEENVPYDSIPRITKEQFYTLE